MAAPERRVPVLIGGSEMAEIDAAAQRLGLPETALMENAGRAVAEVALAELREAAAGDRNLMEPLLDCARAHCTEGEIVESLQRVFGTYTESPVF
jgi:methylmalonyl-CoA mutase N-terminal domain/subunit